MIKKIKNWIKSSCEVIIVCLLALLLLKSCTGCASNRRFEYKTIQYEYTIDSLNTTIENNVIEYRSECKRLNDSIYILNSQNRILIDAINELKVDKEYYRRVNNELVNVTENLSRTNEIDTIKN